MLPHEGQKCMVERSDGSCCWRRVEFVAGVYRMAPNRYDVTDSDMNFWV